MAGAAAAAWRLWRLKPLVAGVLLASVLGGVWSAYRIDLGDLSLTSRSITYGAASTQLLVDSSPSTLTDSSSDLQPLAERALVLSQFLLGDPVKREIARRARIPESTLTVTAQTSIQQRQSQSESPAEQRSNEILADQGPPRRVLVRSDQGSSIISLFTEAPTAIAAEQLADAAAQAAAASLTSLQEDEGTPPARRLVLRRLGVAQGGLLNEGASKLVAGLVGIALFIGGCLLVLLLASLANALRAQRPVSARQRGNPSAAS